MSLASTTGLVTWKIATSAASLAPAFVFALVLAACAPTAEQAALTEGQPGLEPTAEVGDVTVALTLTNEVRLDTVGYTLEGPSFHRDGAIPVGASASVSALLPAIPFGVGYVVTLTARDLEQRFSSCEGSSTFDVRDTQTTRVEVLLSCHEEARTPGAPLPTPAPLPVRGAAVLGVALGALAWRKMRARTRSVGARPSRSDLAS